MQPKNKCVIQDKSTTVYRVSKETNRCNISSVHEFHRSNKVPNGGLETSLLPRHTNEQVFALDPTYKPVSQCDSPQKIHISISLVLCTGTKNQEKPVSFPKSINLPTTPPTNLAKGQHKHFKAALVHFLLRRAVQEADHVRKDDPDVSRGFGGLVLLGPVDDISKCENTRMGLQLEGGLHLDVAFGGQYV